MDTRTPARTRRPRAALRRPTVQRFSTKSAAGRSKELQSILRDIEAGLRRKGITAAERKLLKWINDG